MQADLVAVLVAVTGGQPRILTTGSGRALPAGPFTSNHRSLQASLRTARLPARPQERAAASALKRAYA